MSTQAGNFLSVYLLSQTTRTPFLPITPGRTCFYCLSSYDQPELMIWTRLQSQKDPLDSWRVLHGFSPAFPCLLVYPLCISGRARRRYLLSPLLRAPLLVLSDLVSLSAGLIYLAGNVQVGKRFFFRIVCISERARVFDFETRPPPTIFFLLALIKGVT